MGPHEAHILVSVFTGKRFSTLSAIYYDIMKEGVSE